ncbi:hypothetical protein [Dyella acidiphila]|uniref:Uncharacterized protein n=1 Tax=Dyella acidiphila TaxID=2775866 RepID=A0ABR9G7A4_9GAMM|nr:hypothetical protein [Dyella acidiphila]MBE1159905.1 hypothetical protein [Dyella acidiphila]
MNRSRVVLLAALLLPAACAHDARVASDNQEPVQLHPSPSDDCLYTLWKRMLPFMKKNNSYMSIDDVERLTGVKMQHESKVGPTDTVGIYEQFTLPPTHHPLPPALSLRVETHEETLPINEAPFTWRGSQWQSGSSSTVYLECLGGPGAALTPAEAARDIKAMGLHSAGVLSKGMQRQEVFVDDWNEQISIYYTSPSIVSSTVDSVRITGVKAPKKPPIERQ